MDILLPLAAMAAAVLTFFSGFGLGTILLPAFAISFPLDVAVALTAIVHLVNNFFKLLLVRPHIQMKTLWSFGGPALIGAAAGAAILSRISKHSETYTFDLAGVTFTPSFIGLVIGILMIVFAVFEWIPSSQSRQVSSSSLSLWMGGLLSGYFGGLSGHQGAFRSLFLIRTALTKEQFIATGVAIACMVDVVRLAVYGVTIKWVDLHANFVLLATTIVAALTGSLLGQRYLNKVTRTGIRYMVTTTLIIFGFLIALGIV